MQDLSFHFDNPRFTFHDLTFSVWIYTYENVYGLQAPLAEAQLNENELEVRSAGLTWAGGQESSSGECICRLRRSPQDGSVQVEVRASHTQKIRCIKLTLHDRPRLGLLNLRPGPLEAIPDDGLILNYPEAWQEMLTPLLVFTPGPDGRCPYVRSLDNHVREKRFALVPRGDGMDVELIWEEDAVRQKRQTVVPAWEIGAVEQPETIYARHALWVENAYNLRPWETRRDVPAWARRTALVVALHMQHYTGYIFNDYAQALDLVDWFSTQFPAENTIFYLPGWEGRYYWQYGDYRPDERMGGEAGFAALVNGIQRRGAACMPMFGINVVNKNSPGFEQWGAPSQRIQASGNRCESSVDWDGSRDYDLGWGAMVNPGAPGWQNRLVEQILSLHERYQFKGVFLDISAIWWNDPNFHVYEGTAELVRRLRSGRDDLLVAGEAWYDAMGAVTPLVQCGHRSGCMTWPDVPYPPAFDTYCRSFGHLCLGDPGRGSTGVHELGYNPTWQTPLRKGIIPTVTVVDGTLEAGRAGVEAILEQARQYKEKFL